MEELRRGTQVQAVQASIAPRASQFPAGVPRPPSTPVKNLSDSKCHICPLILEGEQSAPAPLFRRSPPAVPPRAPPRTVRAAIALANRAPDILGTSPFSTPTPDAVFSRTP